MVSDTNIFEKLPFYAVICLKNSCLRAGGILNSLYIGMYVFIAIATPSKGYLYCGNLTLEYFCHGHHVDAKIKLVPNDVIMSTQDNSVTWYHLKNEWIAISHVNNSQKYDKTIFTIIIHDLNDADAGKYALGCMHEEKPYRSGNDISLEKKVGRDLGCDTETSTGIVTSETTGILLNDTLHTPKDDETQSVLFNSTVISVLAICSVIIVLVLAGTVIFVVRKRGKAHTALSRLVSHDGGSTVNLHLDTEPSTSNGIRSSNIYNEIETNTCKGDKHIFNSSKQSLLSLQHSPALPKRPSNAKPIKFDNEIEYDMIKEDKEYSKSNGDPTPGTNKDGELHDNDYATICQRELGMLEVTPSKTINNNSTPEYSKVSKRPVYAKVQKRNESIVTDTSKCSVGNQNEATYMNDYKVAFPAIDYANVVTKLENNEIATLEEPAKYCNLAVRRRSEVRSKSDTIFILIDNEHLKSSV